MTAPRRRWFRFGLRTLFVVVTVSACGLGWFGQQALIVRERQQALAHAKYCGGTISDGLPLAWKVLGAKSVLDLDTGWVESKAEIDRLHLLFPETENVQNLWRYWGEFYPPPASSADRP